MTEVPTDPDEAEEDREEETNEELTGDEKLAAVEPPPPPPPRLAKLAAGPLPPAAELRKLSIPVYWEAVHDTLFRPTTTSPLRPTGDSTLSPRIRTWSLRIWASNGSDAQNASAPTTAIITLFGRFRFLIVVPPCMGCRRRDTVRASRHVNRRQTGSERTMDFIP